MATSKPLETHRNVTAPADKESLQTNSGVQWLLERTKANSTWPLKRERNDIDVLVCGEEGFASIYHDIWAAQKSVDLVCWGFDPGMPLIRSGGSGGSAWSPQHTYGELLKAKATEAGMTIRLLVWYNPRASALQKSLPGYHSGSFKYPAGYFPSRITASKETPLSAKDQRQNYCIDWWGEVLSGLYPNIEVRSREGNTVAVRASMTKSGDTEDTPNDNSSGSDYYQVTEKSLLEKYATHHQKPILIDWGVKDAKSGGDSAVGYIMGLNSISDFWDTKEHLFDDPKREPDWDGCSHTSLLDAKEAPFSREPYQDYAARLRGEVLQDVHDNFTHGWSTGTALPPHSKYPALKQPLASLVARPAPIKPFHAKDSALCQLQVLRTQPDDKTDKTIKAGYLHATEQAQDYLYIENQYFFYEQWARAFQANRTEYSNGIQHAGWDKAKHPILHLMVVLPWPEDAGMVPRTYDTMRMLGNAASLPGQDARTTNEATSELSIHAQALSAARTDTEGVLYLDSKIKGAASQTLGVKALFCRMVTHNAIAIKGVRYKSTAINKDQIGANALMNDQNVMYRQIYIHSKLAIADDTWFTLGSANLNVRSMAGDSEINVACADPGKASALRQRVWGLMTGDDTVAMGGNGGQLDIARAFKKWQTISSNNEVNRGRGLPLVSGFIIPFADNRSSDHRHA